MASTAGDLRYFLLPEPSNAVTASDPLGKTVTSAAAVADSRSESQARAVLTRYRFRDAACLSYDTAGQRGRVTVKLARCGRPALAAAYHRQRSHSGSDIEPLAVGEPFSARAEQTVPGPKYRALLGGAVCGRLRCRGSLVRSAGHVGEDDRPVVQALLVGEPEVQPRGVHVFEEPLS